MKASSLDQPINRYETARVMIRINEKLQGEAKTSTVGASDLISDYKEVPQAYKSYVEQAFMKGLLQGKGDGVYDGNAGGTRAEACVMVVRLVEEAKKAEVKIEQSNTGGSGTVITMPTEVRLNEKGQMVAEDSVKFI